MSSLPLNLYQTTANGREKAVNHPLYKLLYRLPNPETTAYEFIHMFVFNLMLTKGAYAKIVRDRNGFITALWNIPTANTKPGRNSVSGERYIDVYADGMYLETLRDGNYMWTPGLRFTDATDPEDPLRIASEVLGLTMALNSYAEDYFKNGSNIGGFVELPNALGDESFARFKESWQASYEGVTNQHKIAFLEEGAKFHELGKTPEDSQALESRKFEILEICRIFGVPPHLCYDLDRSIFSNIEQQNISYVQDCLSPMSVRIEQSIYKDLLTVKEQDIYFSKFALNGLLRGDIAARTAYYNSARQNGWMNSTEIRELEDMSAIPEEDGGLAYLVNGNYISLKNAANNLPKSMQKT